MAVAPSKRSLMLRLSCPHCEQACMSKLQKLFLAPTSLVSCKSCGRGVTLRWSHYLLVVVPGVLMLVVLNRYFAGFELFITGLVPVLLICILQLMLPLQKDRF